MARIYGKEKVHTCQFDNTSRRQTIIIINRYKNRFKEIECYSKIGTFIANDLNKDGSTLQLGIRATPQQRILNLKQLKNSGTHAEIFGESLLAIFKHGVISNAFKKEHCDRSVASLAIGNQERYEFVDGNHTIYCRNKLC